MNYDTQGDHIRECLTEHLKRLPLHVNKTRSQIRQFGKQDALEGCAVRLHGHVP